MTIMVLRIVTRLRGPCHATEALYSFRYKNHSISVGNQGAIVEKRRLRQPLPIVSTDRSQRQAASRCSTAAPGHRLSPAKIRGSSARRECRASQPELRGSLASRDLPAQGSAWAPSESRERRSIISNATPLHQNLARTPLGEQQEQVSCHCDSNCRLGPS